MTKELFENIIAERNGTGNNEKGFELAFFP